MDPDLLTYVCLNKLPKKHRSKNPATVSAQVIHDWVMQRKKNRLGAEDGDGLKKLKAVRIDLSGEEGERSVQQAFIEIGKIRKEYNLQIGEEEIIKNQMFELKPVSTRVVLKGILKQSNKRAKRARKKLNKFHDLLMEFLETFKEARAFGMATQPAKAPKPQPNPKNPKNLRTRKTLGTRNSQKGIKRGFPRGRGYVYTVGKNIS